MATNEEAQQQQEPVKQLPEQEAPVDIITLLQKKIIHQSQSIYNFLGALQQHAPAQPVVLEEVLWKIPEHPEWAAVTETPKALMENMQQIQNLVDQLPPMQEEGEILNEITSLLQQSNSLDTELREEVAKVEEILYQGHLSTGALSLLELQATALAKARDECTAAEPEASQMQT